MTDLCFLDARELAGMLRRKEVSAREVVTAHLDQIGRVNPQVNAIVTLTAEQAFADAAAADDRLAAGERIGPLHGMPFAFKDTDDTVGVRTTYGSPLFADHVPERDELVVGRVKAAGAITLGKTNVPEFAAGSHTFNEVFGVTRNPYDLSRSAGGSSGGAAAALACGMVPLADGSDMGGSLRNPASFCNVVGFRPSPGRVPTWPNADPWSTMAVQGPLGRTVADAALLLSVQAGPDARSPIAIEQPGKAFAGPLEQDLCGLRVAWSPDLGGAVPVDQAVTDVLTPQVKVFEELGCRVELDCPDLTGAEEVFRTLRARLFDRGLGVHLDEHPNQVKASIAWNINEGRKLTVADLNRAHSLHAALFHRVREFFGQYDLLLLPVSQVVPFDATLEYPTRVAGQPQRSYLDWMRSAYLISATGCPALSVPAGLTPAGLPVGLQIVGPHHADLAVLRAGHAFQSALPSPTRPPICQE
ncbi:amidase [Leekyejoonella antrihumi]|uniref:Amidase n=1 Tax=Leekyejoonella antrihumi TaxID=1660198 RepID=A0A563DV52_9MICO|nr:amidase [Leekyejoonella antrihumi]TWP33803.1 amidase [Leekyejoonella antrihumi]